MITIYKTGSFHPEPGKLINFSDSGEKDFTTSNGSDKFKYKEEVRISATVDLKGGNDEIKISSDSGTSNILYVDEQGVLKTGDGVDTINAKHLEYEQYSEFTPGIYINGKIDMGEGDDIITGSPLVINGGAALISMGSGNDKILAPFTGNSNGTIDFGSGIDELLLEDGTYTVQATSQGSFSITKTGNQNFRNKIKSLERLVNKQGNYIELREGSFSTTDFNLTSDSNHNPSEGSNSQITRPSKFNKNSADKITNFNPSTDTLEIDTDSFGINSSATFAAGKNKKAVKKQLAKQDIDFLYDEKKGGLYFNENGADKGFGDGGIVAILKGAPDLTSSNLEFI
jgi:hypothetical protein